MSRDNSFALAYTQNIEANIEKGYAEECPNNHISFSSGSRFWYLPHFAVFHPQKKKLRVVHDAAAALKGTSLNSLLLPGPDLLQSLLSILFRWREGKVALMADIKEMFPQIKIRKEDQDMQRFLWRGGDPNAPVKEYRMTSMIFGAASSPCTAIYVLNKNAMEHSNGFPKAALATPKNHYMGDFIISMNDVDEAAQMAADIVALHKLACFEMRGWVSNCPEALRLLDPDRLAASPADIPVGPTASPINNIRTLGLTWDPKNDTFGFRSNVSEDTLSVLTKRVVLSQAMRIYDPLGILAPITIHGRILIQNAWRAGVGWDEPLPKNLSDRWQAYLRSVSTIGDIKVPRWYLGCLGQFDLEMHIFCDASELAYACVAYWRFVSDNGDIKLSLIASKARVTPLKPVSIPRLELQGALLAARLANTIISEHDRKPSRRFFWTDSMNVLGWLRKDSRILKPFVAHRVGEISETTNITEWRWVPTSLNVADDATRISEVVPSRWFTGPSFLLSPEECWPSEVSPDSFQDLPDLKREIDMVNLEVEEDSSSSINLPPPLAADPTRFSKWLRMVRTTARVHQFLKILRSRLNSNSGSSNRLANVSVHPHESPPLSSLPYRTSRDLPVLQVKDLIDAEHHIFRRSQSESFGEELIALKSSKRVDRRSRLANLDPVLGMDGLIRMTGRIGNASDIPSTMKSPIILDGRHYSVRLLVDYYHRRAAHASNSFVINEIRQKYWILHLRNVVRSVAINCQFCRIRRAQPLEPLMGDLPAERLAHHRRPFSFVGLDYMGPLMIAVGRRREKRWIALFTCMTTRAVHLDIVGTLTADGALMCLRRFIARRGSPVKIFSDNGTAFVGASRKLKDSWDEVVDFATARCIEWVFIPPASPHMGGAWERLVRSVKTALKWTLNEKFPREELLRTLLLEAEALVNSRPLTHISLSPDEPESLTPFHFIIGSSSLDQPIKTDEGDLVRRSDWRKSQRLADMFWTRWVNEYLPTLLPRRRTASTPNLQIGDLVLIVDGNLPRGTWPRGRIVKVFPGRDNVVRVAEIQNGRRHFEKSSQEVSKVAD